MIEMKLWSVASCVMIACTDTSIHNSFCLYKSVQFRTRHHKHLAQSLSQRRCASL